MTIEIISPTKTLVDGEDLGALFDVLANHPGLPRPDVQRAFLAFVARLEEAQRAAVAAMEADRAQQLQELKETHRTEMETAEGVLTAARSEAATTQQQVRDELATLTSAQQQALSELTETRAFAAEVITRAKGALADDKLSEQERLELLKSLVDEAERPAKQRQAAALAAEIAAKQAELAQLTAT